MIIASSISLGNGWLLAAWLYRFVRCGARISVNALLYSLDNPSAPDALFNGREQITLLVSSMEIGSLSFFNESGETEGRLLF